MLQPSKQQADGQGRAPLSCLQRLWESGGFVLTLQVLSPSLLAQATLKKVATVLPETLPAVLVADAADGAIALNTLAQAVLLRRNGLVPIVQLGGRDRNRLALQSDLLGLGALNLPDVLIDTRPITRASLGQHADARLVLDLDGPALLAAAACLRDEARLLSGARIRTPPAFYLGALIGLEQPLPREKLMAAQFLVTEPLTHSRLCTALPLFAQAYADFLRPRPLLVSLTLDARALNEQKEAGVQALRITLHRLQQERAVRGWNIVIADAAALAALEELTAIDHGLLERPG